jgi:hypothetical protein
MKNIKLIILLFGFISLLNCQNNEKKVIDNKEIEIKNFVFEKKHIKFNFKNKSKNVCYLLYAYTGDLDKRPFPKINYMDNSEIEVSFKPFVSKVVEDFNLKHEEDEPGLVSADFLEFMRIEKNEDKFIEIPFSLNKNYKKITISLFYFKNKDSILSKEVDFFGCSPTSKMLKDYKFKEKTIVINK